MPLLQQISLRNVFLLLRSAVSGNKVKWKCLWSSGGVLSMSGYCSRVKGELRRWSFLEALGVKLLLLRKSQLSQFLATRKVC